MVSYTAIKQSKVGMDTSQVKASNPEKNQEKPKPDRARLDFLISQKALPNYLQVLKEKPQEEDWEPEPSAVARQAATEWPGVARQWSLPEGQILGSLPKGVVLNIGGLLVFFDLELLWKSIGVLPCGK